MLKQKQDVIDLAQPMPPTDEPGIYFLIHEGEIVYVGQTTQVYTRVMAHRTDKAFDSFTFVPCDREDMNELERKYIIAFDPKYNRSLPFFDGLISRGIVRRTITDRERRRVLFKRMRDAEPVYVSASGACFYREEDIL